MKDKTGCPCSAGFGGNRLLARLATKKAKPNGQFHLKSEDLEEFMNNVKVADLPGVGHSTSQKLKKIGIHNCEELREVSMTKLQSEFGKKLGEQLYKYSRGIDERSLTFHKERKSVSAEVNYGIRFKSDSERDIFIKQLSDEVSNRLESLKIIGRSITLKLMIRSPDAPEETAKFLGHGVCDVINKSITLSNFVSDSGVIFREVLSILRKSNVNTKDIRGIGIQISRLKKCKSGHFINLNKFFAKQNLFHTSEKDNAKNTCHQTEDVLKPKNVSGEKGSSTSLSILSQEVDPEFLEALPEDLKKEVLANLNELKNDERLLQNSKSVSEPKSETVLFSSKSKGSHLQNIEVSESIKHVSPKVMKEMVKHWVNTEDLPQSCDIIMLKEYLQSMVTTYQIEDLHVILKTLYREITSHSDLIVWKEVYSNVISGVQKVMLEIYGAKLMIEENFGPNYPI